MTEREVIAIAQRALDARGLGERAIAVERSGAEWYVYRAVGDDPLNAVVDSHDMIVGDDGTPLFRSI